MPLSDFQVKMDKLLKEQQFDWQQLLKLQKDHEAAMINRHKIEFDKVADKPIQVQYSVHKVQEKERQQLKDQQAERRNDVQQEHKEQREKLQNEEKERVTRMLEKFRKEQLNRNNGIER